MKISLWGNCACTRVLVHCENPFLKINSNIFFFLNNPFYRQRQADRNRAKVLERLQKRKQKGGTDKRSSNSSKSPQLSQEECLASLRKFVGMAPIAGIQKQTLVNITKVCMTEIGVE